MVEGRIGKDGVFQASTIMAKHAEEYSPHEGSQGAPNSFVPAKEYTARSDRNHRLYQRPDRPNCCRRRNRRADTFCARPPRKVFVCHWSRHFGAIRFCDGSRLGIDLCLGVGGFLRSLCCV